MRPASNNFSSMYQNLSPNKKSKIDHINEYAIQRVKQFKIDVPKNIFSFSKVKNLESRTIEKGLTGVRLENGR
ncbi:ketopantoate reductase C-terminal domain-containing protein [Candidatus Riesia pediculischaeffi]|uniref:2-dehydropantoate 2-reductase n=1 Tax=Candidatus Riesia pediculischaeffi PTSU TaxID=1401651 RepID=A0A0C1VIV6_9ENTR|nr:2-dehydropantoate 2-reductase [Candidatus Riesia pediculischaeffi PTSU]